MKKTLIWGGIIFAILPIVVSIGAGWFASSHGCQLNEGSPNPCIVGGVDYANTLYSLGLSFLYMFITIPVGGAIAAIGFLKKGKNDVAVVAPQDTSKPKRLIWTGLLLIFVPPILQILLSLLISMLGMSILPVYAVISIIGPLVWFATMFCVPLGIVVLIVGIVRYLKAKN